MAMQLLTKPNHLILNKNYIQKKASRLDTAMDTAMAFQTTVKTVILSAHL